MKNICGTRRSFFLAIAACNLVSGAIAEGCPQLSPSNTYILLHGKNTGPDGAMRDVSYCLSRDNEISIIDHLDHNEKLLMKIRYYGIYGLSSENIKNKKIIKFSYSKNIDITKGIDVGDKIKFVLTTEFDGQAPLPMKVSIDVEGANPVTISSCSLRPLKLVRRNFDWNGNSAEIVITFSPELNWSIATATGPRLGPDGKVVVGGSTFLASAIAPAEEAQRVCSAAQPP